MTPRFNKNADTHRGRANGDNISQTILNSVNHTDNTCSNRSRKSTILNNTGGSFSVAGEYRVGSRRVQGVFGGGLLYAFSSQSYKYSYGNAITELNQSPSTGIAGCDVLPPKDGFTYQRYLSQFQDNPTHYFGLVAFAGVEWFFAPWVSLGAEVNIAAAWHWNKATYYKAEGFNNLNGQTETWTELISPRSSGFDFGTGNIGGNLTLTFYINRNR